MPRTSKNEPTRSTSKTLASPLKPNQTPEHARAELMVQGLATNVVTAIGYTKTLGEVDVTEAMAALVDTFNDCRAATWCQPRRCWRRKPSR